MTQASKDRGVNGELLAARFLKGEGMEVVEMNYRHGRGEIDLILRDGETLVFCEVKARSSDRFGTPEYAVTPRKQHQLRRLAAAYLYHHEIRDVACRFDVIAIRVVNGQPVLNHIRNAFQ